MRVQLGKQMPEFHLLWGSPLACGRCVEVARLYGSDGGVKVLGELDDGRREILSPNGRPLSRSLHFAASLMRYGDVQPGAEVLE